MSGEVKVFFTVSLIAAVMLLFAFLGAYVCDSITEISTLQYEELSKLVHSSPNFDLYYMHCYEDKKISIKEYHNLKQINTGEAFQNQKDSIEKELFSEIKF